MFLPPATAYLTEYKMSYGELRGKMIAQSRDPLARAAAAKGEAVVVELSLPAGCDVGYTSLHSGVKMMASCATGQVWCWATCEDVSAYNLSCPASEAICVGPDGQPANPDDHNTSNHPGCPPA